MKGLLQYYKTHSTGIDAIFPTDGYYIFSKNNISLMEWTADVINKLKRSSG
jgi:hypothetical protein